MAKIVITIEDGGDTEGGVFINCDPPLEQLVALSNAPEKATSAHGYAWVALLALNAEAGGALHDLMKTRRH